MKIKTAWILGILAILCLLAIPVVGFISRLLGYRSLLWRGGMMGGYGMMNSGSNGYISPLGWLGMLWMWLIPLGLLLLVAVGIAALFGSRPAPVQPGFAPASTLTPATPTASERLCQSCGKAAQPDWNSCPYCGQLLN
jgi:hypothetical protein